MGLLHAPGASLGLRDHVWIYGSVTSPPATAHSIVLRISSILDGHLVGVSRRPILKDLVFIAQAAEHQEP
jgi:hypothetical protein